MGFLKNVMGAADAFRKHVTGANGAFNTIVNLSQTASAADKVWILRGKLEKAKTETEKKQLEEELREAQALLEHYKDLVNKDEEANAQSRDRISRILGTDTERSKHLFRQKEETDCLLKNKGDRFELKVGRHFEREGCFVFYNGMLRSAADQGIDLVAYDRHAKVVRYIQCKNWEAMVLDFDNIMTILRKMSSHRISPTRVEIERQQQAGWSNGSHFDDSAYYKVE
jgi:hypothetical protein